MFNIHRINAFSDNYIWVIEREGNCILVDPGDCVPVIEWLNTHNKKLTAILLTHHHSDHCGGVPPLTKRYPNTDVYAPATESISGVTHPVKDGDNIEILGGNFRVIGTQGHTKGHISYYGDKKLFSGDALFSAGCGRLFEGSAKQMYLSLQKLKTLPDETLVYSAHEYTLANLKFAHHIEPNNQALLEYSRNIEQLRKQGQASLPSTIGLEKKINPFLRSDTPELLAAITEKINSKDPIQIFATLRQWKDNFSG